MQIEYTEMQHKITAYVNYLLITVESFQKLVDILQNKKPRKTLLK